MITKQANSFLPSRLRLSTTVAIGPVLMLSSALLFAVMDCLIKVSGSSFRIWDIAFYRFACGLGILVMVFGWRRNPFDGPNRKLLMLRGITGSLSFFQRYKDLPPYCIILEVRPQQ